MYAIVEIAGQQYKVKRGDRVISHRLKAKEGDLVEFDKVLLIEDNGKVNVGTPTISGAKVAASVVHHLRGEKLIIFKKKRRKGYQKWNGHRQELSELLIQEVLPQGGKVKELLELPKKNKESAQSGHTNSSKKAETPATKSKPTQKAAAKKTTSKKKKES